jgi:hypothetical protein
VRPGQLERGSEDCLPGAFAAGSSQGPCGHFRRVYERTVREV